MNLKLGKKPKRIDLRTLKLADYLSASLPPIPYAQDWTTKVQSWGVFLNDSLGDCTCAAAAHHIMGWTSNAGTLVTPADNDILTAYEAVGGYNPNDPSTDQGAVELDVLKYWKNTGIAGHQIAAFVEVDITNLDEVKTAIALFGGLYIGVQLPQSAMSDFESHLPWTNTTDAHIEGGHALPLLAYTPNDFTCITWGQAQPMSAEWFSKYADEGYAVISKDFLEASGQSPSGLDWTALQNDLKEIQS